MEERPCPRGATCRAQFDPGQPDRAEVSRPQDLRLRDRRTVGRRRRDGRGPWGERRRELPRWDQGMARRGPATGDTMSPFAPTTEVAPDATVKPEDVIEVLRER